MTTQAAVDAFLSGRRLVLAGASSSGKAFGNAVLGELTRKGWEIVPVHPRAAEIDGHACWRTLAEVPGDLHGLIVSVRPDRAEGLVREAAARGIRHVWLQQGAGSRAAIAAGDELDLNVVHGECILMYARPDGLHKLHYWLWDLIGRTPRKEPV